MINEDTSLEELAAIVSEALEEAGITATLAGGAAVSIYSDNKYESVDLDFVTAHCMDRIEWRALDQWVVSEGIQSSKEVVEYYEKIKRKRPA